MTALDIGQHIVKWITAILISWTTLTGGIVSVALMTFQAVKEKTLEWTTIKKILAVTFIASSFISWNDEYSNRLQRIEPSLEISYYQLDNLPNADAVRLFALVTLRNPGSSQVFTDWTVIFPSEERLPIEMQVSPELTVHSPRFNLVCTGADSLSARTSPTLIPSGGVIYGYVIAQITGRRASDLTGSAIQLTYRDSTGTLHRSNLIKLSEVAPPLMFTPGLCRTTPPNSMISTPGTTKGR